MAAVRTVRHGRQITLTLPGPDGAEVSVTVAVWWARRGEARLVVEAPRAVAISYPTPAPQRPDKD